MNRGLQSISVVLICFLNDFVEAPNDDDIRCQFTYIAAVVTKTLVTSICLGVQFDSWTSRYIDNNYYADYSNRYSIRYKRKFSRGENFMNSADDSGFANI